MIKKEECDDVIIIIIIIYQNLLHWHLFFQKLKFFVTDGVYLRLWPKINSPYLSINKQIQISNHENEGTKNLRYFCCTQREKIILVLIPQRKTQAISVKMTFVPPTTVPSIAKLKSYIISYVEFFFLFFCMCVCLFFSTKKLEDGLQKHFIMYADCNKHSLKQNIEAIFKTHVKINI